MNRQIGINSIVSGYYMMVAYDSYLLMVLYQSMNSYNPMDYQLDHCNTSPMVIFFYANDPIGNPLWTANQYDLWDG